MHLRRDLLALPVKHADIETLLSSGTTPEYDTVGGSMTAVVRNMSQLKPEDRKAMAAYLKSLAPIDNPKPKAPLVGAN